MEIAKAIKKLAEEKGETIASVERKAGIGRATIRDWDNHIPSIDKVIKVADFFDVSLDDLVGRTLQKKEEAIPNNEIIKYLSVIPENEKQKELARLELLAEQAEEKKLLG